MVNILQTHVVFGCTKSVNSQSVILKFDLTFVYYYYCCCCWKAINILTAEKLFDTFPFVKCVYSKSLFIGRLMHLIL